MIEGPAPMDDGAVVVELGHVDRRGLVGGPYVVRSDTRCHRCLGWGHLAWAWS